MRRVTKLIWIFLASALAVSASAREEPYFHTFSIAAVDPSTGEVGVAVTTRNPCVGNGVPWVRAGIGAVATQASTRTEYGAELLDLLESGASAERALERALAGDDRSAHRQIGIIGLAGGSAQHTGSETRPWSGHRAGRNYVTQGNLLVGPGVLQAVARSFESTEGSGRHLADRLIAALEAGQEAGGDARKGRSQSAAVLVADPREGHSRRPDKVSTNVNVCEHDEPVKELRRVYEAISQTLGFRTLQQFAGKDVVQLRMMLEALGVFPNGPNGPNGGGGRNGMTKIDNGDEAMLYTPDLAAAVDAFRHSEGLSTTESGSPPGLVDAQTVALLWRRLEEAGKARAVLERIREITAVTR